MNLPSLIALTLTHVISIYLLTGNHITYMEELRWLNSSYLSHTEHHYHLAINTTYLFLSYIVIFTCNLQYSLKKMYSLKRSLGFKEQGNNKPSWLGT